LHEKNFKKNTGGRFLLIVVIALGLFPPRTRTASSLLANKDICGVSFLYNATDGHTSGACPQLEDGQSETVTLHNLLQSLNIRWCGFNGDGSGMDIPAYYLCFVNESGAPQVTMYIPSTGYLYCGHWIYRATSPSMEEAWSQLDSLYGSAILLSE
jgi:hypothetical protein